MTISLGLLCDGTERDCVIIREEVDESEIETIYPLEFFGDFIEYLLNPSWIEENTLLSSELCLEIFDEIKEKVRKKINFYFSNKDKKL